jgi:RNA polymerase primary sigma factor
MNPTAIENDYSLSELPDHPIEGKFSSEDSGRKRSAEILHLVQSGNLPESLEEGKHSDHTDDRNALLESAAKSEIVDENAVLSGEGGDEPGTSQKTIDDKSTTAPDLLPLYLREVSAIPLLSGNDEIELARDIAQGKRAGEVLESCKDEEFDPGSPDRNTLLELAKKGEVARQRLTESNLRLVVSVAKRYSGRGIALLDLIQEGNVGLLRAVDKFDYSRGYRFSTYAMWWIRHFIQQALWEKARIIHIPGQEIDVLRELSFHTATLRQSFNREPTVPELAEELGLSDDYVAKLLKISQELLSLENPVGEDGGSILGDFIEDPQTVEPDNQASQILLRENLLQELKNLDERERQVLSLRFGINKDREQTLEEIARFFGVSSEGIRRIEKRGLRKMRHSNCSAKLLAYLGA